MGAFSLSVPNFGHYFGHLSPPTRTAQLYYTNGYTSCTLNWGFEEGIEAVYGLFGAVGENVGVEVGGNGDATMA